MELQIWTKSVYYQLEPVGTQCQWDVIQAPQSELEATQTQHYRRWLTLRGFTCPIFLAFLPKSSNKGTNSIKAVYKRLGGYEKRKALKMFANPEKKEDATRDAKRVVAT